MAGGPRERLRRYRHRLAQVQVQEQNKRARTIRGGAGPALRAERARMPHPAGITKHVLHVLRRCKGPAQRDEERGARRGAHAAGDKRRDRRV